MFCTNDSLVLDHTRMHEALEHRDLVRELVHFLLRLARELDALHGDDATRVEVQGAVDGPKLSSTDTLA